MRIIAGLYKGRTLLPPPGQAVTRPITGHVKKSLFGMLGEDLTGWRIADLYCGTGTLGIEALSRGAAHAYFAEMDGRVVERLRRNLLDVGAVKHSTVWAGDVTRSLAGWLSQVDKPLDLVFVDPPYAQSVEWDWDQMAQRIFIPLAGKLTADGIVTLRASDEADVPEVIGPLKAIRRRQYGNMVLSLYKKNVTTEGTETESGE